MSEGQGTATNRVEEGSRPPDPLLGRVIAGRFKITSLIARGGMGKVYRAEQAPLGRLCAIKVLNPNYNGDADPEFHRRFFREASITSKITHPNSVTIFDYGKTEDDIYFMAMEYLEGQTLHQALRDGGVMHEIRAGRIAAQICRALREAHKLGVIHRDLKPANIFLTRPNTQPPDASGSIPPASEEDEDFVKVLDFGLVKHLSERPEEQLTQTGLFMGSPKYMAPEQIQGGHVDERTDIYSLGIIMYEMLAGKVPFERATSVNILMAHVGEPPPPMRAVNPNLVCSPAFEEIVMSCIAKSPNERLSSMDQLLQAIRRAHGGSLTGQLTALSATGQLMAVNATAQRMAVNATGQFVAGMAPPALPSALGSSAAGAVAATSNAPVLARAEPSNDVASGSIELQPRSKLWIALGVLVAAVLGGGLGMLAFHWTAPEATPAPAPPQAAAAPVAAAPAASPDAPPEPKRAAEPTPAKLDVTSDPTGASVQEDGKELCAATPCELVFKDDGPHRLHVAHPGYRSETRSVKPRETAVHVKLVHTGSPVRPAAPPPSPKPDTTKPEQAPPPNGTTPNGFKDQPY
ncbi:MAG TPA: serine/threonine-protein kinase [Labilithrix sp.]|nr:serine/threonine-protein kinase [Labilithrix sp.]